MLSCTTIPVEYDLSQMSFDLCGSYSKKNNLFAH